MGKRQRRRMQEASQLKRPPMLPYNQSHAFQILTSPQTLPCLLCQCETSSVHASQLDWQDVTSSQFGVQSRSPHFAIKEAPNSIALHNNSPLIYLLCLNRKSFKVSSFILSLLVFPFFFFFFLWSLYFRVRSQFLNLSLYDFIRSEIFLKFVLIGFWLSCGSKVIIS